MFVSPQVQQGMLPKRIASMEGKSVTGSRKEDDWRNLDIEEIEREIAYQKQVAD